MREGRFSLAGQVAVVTGAGRGIGKGIALALAEAGADVVIASRTEQELLRVAEAIGTLGRRCEPVPADVTRVDAVRTLVDRALARFGQIDVLVNNAGAFQRWCAPENIEEAEWDRVQHANLRSLFLCSREAARAMIPRRQGAIVHVTSIAGGVALPSMAAYCAAKAGVIGLTRSLAIDWARHNVRVNAVAPAFIANEATEADIRRSPGLVETVRASTPLGRFGEVEEVAAAVLFLASPAASYVTGHTLFVDGGWTAR